MDVFNHGWYDANSVRQYPLAMEASGIDDFDNPATTSLLEDVSLYVPEHLGVSQVYLGSGHISSSVASAVFIGRGTGGAIPLCSVVLTPGVSRMVAVEPLTDGVRGWVVLGKPTANDAGRWVFSSPAQSALAAGCWKTYRRPPVTGLTAGGRTLIGDVGIAGIGHMVASVETRFLQGRDTQAVVLRLDPTLSAETLAGYASECARPDGECSPPPIQTINKVRPDANGDITIEVKGIDLSTLVDTDYAPYGIVLRSQVGMIDVCPGDKGLSIDEIETPECV